MSAAEVWGGMRRTVARPGSKPGERDPRRGLPAVGAVCDAPAARGLSAQFGRAAVAGAVREVLVDLRAHVAAGLAPSPTIADLLDEAARRLSDGARETLSEVINATGVVIHTNLGRAPLAPEAIAAIAAAAGYGNLEFDLETGRRSSRHVHLAGLIADVTGAEGGLAVNNGAGAVLLALAALAAGGPVIVSRGELVEIGGGFRVPDVVRQSGGRLVEVGTTNRTHLRDYEQAVREYPDARIILRTHPSNFRLVGFTSAPALDELARFAHGKGMLLVEDLGGGALIDLAPFGIEGEPMVQDSLRAGVDLTIFSGDKLLGGPQAGVVAGRRDLVAQLERHPLARALRLDKLSLAALAATLRLYRPPSDPAVSVPVLRMLTESVTALQERARALQAAIADLEGLEAAIVDTEAYAGGGAMPMHALASRALALRCSGQSTEQFARRLRIGRPAVVGRIESDRVLLDMRTVADAEAPALAKAVRLAVAPAEH